MIARGSIKYVAALLAAVALVVNHTATAHSASDAYLTLTVGAPAPSGTIIHGQWDIALRDLDFVLKLDENGDGRLTWGEVRRRQAEIENYAYQHLKFGGNCTLKPGRQMIDEHADGAYAALFFDVICPRQSVKIDVRYSLFFAIDPSHRGIFVMNRGSDVATALLSPTNDRIDLGF